VGRVVKTIRELLGGLTGNFLRVPPATSKKPIEQLGIPPFPFRMKVLLWARCTISSPFVEEKERWVPLLVLARVCTLPGADGHHLRLRVFDFSRRG